MKFITSISFLAAFASAVPHAKTKTPSPLELRLEVSNNTNVKAKLTNTGNTNLRLLKSGTILSDRPTRKATLLSGANKLPFKGIHININTDHLNDRAFVPLSAGQSIEFEFDVAKTYNLGAGGKHSIHSQGRIPYAKEGSNVIAGSFTYNSNTIDATIDGSKAASALIKRAEIVKCKGDEKTALENAVVNCKKLAKTAQDAAKSGSAARMEEYFMSSSKSTRATVADVYSKVQDQCDSTDSGTTASCVDRSNHCEESGAIAYTHDGYSMYYCDPFWEMSAKPAECHQKSQATTFLHETTHLSAVKDTDDIAYGYSNLRKLSATKALQNADAYALFANAVNLDCDTPSDGGNDDGGDDE